MLSYCCEHLSQKKSSSFNSASVFSPNPTHREWNHSKQMPHDTHISCFELVESGTQNAAEQPSSPFSFSSSWSRFRFPEAFLKASFIETPFLFFCCFSILEFPTSLARWKFSFWCLLSDGWLAKDLLHPSNLHICIFSFTGRRFSHVTFPVREISFKFLPEVSP